MGLFTIILVTSNMIDIPSFEAKYVFSNKWGTLGSGNGQFNSPGGVAIDSSYRIYVADTENNRIQLFKLATTCSTGTSQIVSGVCFVRAWGTVGTGNGQFKNPGDVALDSSGRVYVADTENNRVQMFKGNGNFMKTWNTDGPGTAQFGRIVGVAIDTSTNDIYVADQSKPGYIHKFRLAVPCPAGTTQVISGICFVDRWTFGSAPEHPPDPVESVSDVAVDSSTHDVYVSFYRDYHMEVVPDQYSIIKLKGNGSHVGSWGGDAGTGLGQFYSPTGVSVGSLGRVYVADTGNARIQAFHIQKFQVSLPCPVGTTLIKFGVCLVTQWGSPGSGNGQFDHPSDVTVGPLHAYVADSDNHRIQEFRWLEVGGGGGGTSPNIAVK